MLPHVPDPRPLAPGPHRSAALLALARRYVREQDLTDVDAVLVGGSVAWGLASPVSDVDVYFVAPSIEGRASDKIVYHGEYIDHVWVAHSVFTDRAALLDDDFRSYTFSRVIVLEDREKAPEHRLAEVSAWLQEQIARVSHMNRYVERRLAAGQQVEEAVSLSVARREFANLGRLLARAAMEYGQALLHRVPAGHCGIWTAKLGEWARSTGEWWVPQTLEAILFPEGLPSTGLTALIDDTTALHARASTPPRGPDVGCSPANSEFFARKARFYLGSLTEPGDVVSCLVVLRRLAYYAENSIATKLAVKDDSRVQQEAETLQAALTELNARLWAGSPTSAAGAERALAALAALRQRAEKELLARVGDE